MHGKLRKRRVCAKAHPAPPPPPATAGTIAATIALPGQPSNIAAGEGSIWVTLQGGGLLRIDPATNAIIAHIDTGPPQGYSQALVVAEGSVWLTNYTDSTVSRIDAHDYRLLATIPVGDGPEGIAAGPGAIWVANNHTESVSRIDPTTNTVVATIPVGPVLGREGPAAIDVTTNGVWTAVPNLSAVVRVDPATNQVVATVPGGDACGNVSATPDQVWAGCGNVVRMDPATNKAVTTLTVGDSARSVLVGLGSVWVETRLTLDRIDPATNKVVGRLGIPNGAAPFDAIAVFGDLAISNGLIWALESRAVLRIEPAG